MAKRRTPPNYTNWALLRCTFSYADSAWVIKLALLNSGSSSKEYEATLCISPRTTNELICFDKKFEPLWRKLKIWSRYKIVDLTFCANWYDLWNRWSLNKLRRLLMASLVLASRDAKFCKLGSEASRSTVAAKSLVDNVLKDIESSSSSPVLYA